MSGYDRSQFIDLSKSLEEELSCGICLNVLNSPMTTRCCRHSYCKQCITQWLSTNKSCPNDRQSLTKQDLVQSSRIVTNLLDKQQVYCNYKTNGCQQITQLSQLAQHLSQCWFNPQKAEDKCHQILRSLESSVDKLKNRNKNPNLTPDLQYMKSQICLCLHELKAMNSKQNCVQTVIQPNTQSFKHKIIESAKTNIDCPLIIDCEMSEGLKQKIVKKSKDAIMTCDSYENIAYYLVNQLNNGVYDWSASVYPINSICHFFSDFSFKIELSFGDLCILLVCKPCDEESNEGTETSSDFYDWDE